MAPDFDVIVIGSGFGAAVAAIDQAGKGKTVFILERGVWWLTPELSAEKPMNPFLKTQPVQYWPRPDHRRGLVDFLAVVKANGVAGALQDFANGVAEFFTDKPRPRPLYRYNTFGEADVISASGVGGGSLIYSNVTIEPFFDTTNKQYPAMASWPEKAKLLPADYANGLAWMTTNRGAPNQVVTKYPQAIPQNQLNTVKSSDPRLLGRSRFLRDASTSPNLSPQLAGQIVEPWAPLKLQIKEADPGNTATNKNFCERQGRCFLGCLPAARHTLNKTLLNQLPLAAQDKILIRALANVESIEAIPGSGYTVHYTGLDDDTEYHPTAKTVILAAGCLGSTEILLRSRDKSNGKFVVSKTLGTKFSTNGDFSGFVTIDQDKLQYPIYATRGPINTSHVTFRDGKLLVNVEDAGIPAMFASLVEKTLKMLEQDKGQADAIDMLGLLWNNAQLPDYSDPNDMQTEAEMLMNTCWFNCMGMDDATGILTLDGDDLQLKFTGAIAKHPTFQKAESVLQELAKAMGGTYRAFPLWHGLEPFVSKKLVVVHPLGGCPIGGSSTDGVVNSNGQVYNTNAGAETVYGGLYVLDASIIPGAVAVNPTLSIVSMAARAVKSIA